jgi:hypothetical protein
MEKLIPMTDFVEFCRKSNRWDNVRRFWACERYVKFLKQPLKLEMFVNPVPEPELMGGNDLVAYDPEWVYFYEKGEENILFEINDLPELSELEKLIKGENIELLADGETKLTPTALKQIGL